jgi:sugar lactone lactonase YvrE
MTSAGLHLVHHYRAVIGEGPLWSPQANALYWLDTVAKKIIRYSPSTRTSEVRDLMYRPSCIGLTHDRRVLIGFKKGLALFDFESATTQPLELRDIGFEDALFNDGACDAAGRLWIGTMDRKVAQPVGALYCIGGDLRVERAASGFTVSNGIAWSPDGTTMYHADSRPGRVYACDFDVCAGTLSNRRVLIDYAGTGRRPDGCTVDAEGGLWVAEIDGGRIARYTPAGVLDREIMLPVRKPTSVMFGGSDLSTLYVTSMSYGIAEAELAASESAAGLLMSIDAGVRGLPERVFGLAAALSSSSDTRLPTAG